MNDMGLFSSLGEAWVAVLQTLYKESPVTEYTDNTGELFSVKEAFALTFAVANASLPDAIIERHKVQAEYDWMVRNFTVQKNVKELHDEHSCASRLCSCMGRQDQIRWVIDRPKAPPTPGRQP